MYEVKCPYCGAGAELVTGAVIYPHRADLATKRFYACMPCRAWVGCHPRTVKPLGRLARASLRKAKQRAHAAFDPIWRGGRMSRDKAYKWLAGKLGIPKGDCHIGMFDERMCAKVEEIMREHRG